MDVTMLIKATVFGAASLVCSTAGAVTYTYTSPDLYLQNPIDPSVPADPITRTFSFWFDENYLGGTTAGSSVSVVYSGAWWEYPVETAYRDGALIPYDQYLHAPIATTTMDFDSLGGSFRFTFDNLGDVDSFWFGTDGEQSSTSFSDQGASIYSCTICAYTPHWFGSGPGTWTHDPVAPVPIGPTLPLSVSGLLMLSAFSHRRLGARNRADGGAGKPRIGI